MMAEALAAGQDESEAELSQSLARTKTRSYGSTASVSAPLRLRNTSKHPWSSPRRTTLARPRPMRRMDSLMEQIKRTNKLFTSDCIFLRKTLIIPVMSEKGLLFNGLNSLESPENESRDTYTLSEERPLNMDEESSTSPSPEYPDNKPIHPEELSAKDFLQRLDLQIKLSTQAAAKTLQEDDIGAGDTVHKDGSYAGSSYQSHH
ncbi:lysM and putative peptidoglycan-binding domain-containing protein 2 [Scyliorhinus canicula]|uniref:lysM and putative peptidoglycan-binding domain-containing protein 2 n=1 Tax=Scyliorhinus canicula TaxID=7830 RepID=UPI0018F77015|nr:lysM and putative peptidoglycan-binding domain-containing protein 2 [Scyliorhinus canicula]